MDYHRLRTYLLLLATCLILVGARPACRPPPNIDCDNFSLSVPPGTCVDIDNPCAVGGDWAEVDHFRLYQEPDGLFIRGKEGAGGTVGRQICAAETVGEYEEEEVSFLYTKVNRRRRPDYGQGFVYITTIPDPTLLAAEATATPTEIALGDSTMLAVVASSGTPPYTYLWMEYPPGSIYPGDVSHDTVWAKPLVTTKYIAAVTDSHGDVEADSVIVTVGFSASFTMDPDTINIGDTSQFLAEVIGGREPYVYNWASAATLSADLIPNPRAFPVRTTIYQLDARDADNLFSLHRDTLFVRLEAEATASPSTIPLGDSVLLTASFEGGAPHYTYSWSPPATIDEPTGSVLSESASTYAWPTENTTFVVSVTDIDGLQDVDSAHVTVTTPEELWACYSWAPETPPTLSVGEQANFDPSCSTGEIVAWLWWPDYNGDSTVYDSATTGAVHSFTYDTPGEYVVILRVIDALGDTWDHIDLMDVIP